MTLSAVTDKGHRAVKLSETKSPALQGGARPPQHLHLPWQILTALLWGKPMAQTTSAKAQKLSDRKIGNEISAYLTQP